MELKLARRLREVPDLGAHQVTASQLATNGMEGNPIYQSNHLGRTIAVRRYGAMLTGPLRSVTDSRTESLLILGIGDYLTVAVPYTWPVTVAPDGYRMSVTVRPPKAEGEKP